MESRIIRFYASDGACLNGYINEVNSKKNKVLILEVAKLLNI